MPVNILSFTALLIKYRILLTKYSEKERMAVGHATVRSGQSMGSGGKSSAQAERGEQRGGAQDCRRETGWVTVHSDAQTQGKTAGTQLKTTAGLGCSGELPSWRHWGDAGC